MDIIVRPANSNDAQRIWEIRNTPEARSVAASPDIVPLEQHIDWFNKKYFSNTANHCFVAEDNGNTVGYCRFDIDPKSIQFIISIATDPSTHGKGIGTHLLAESVRLLRSTIPLHAEVRKFNTVSLKMFERCGFKKKSEDETNVYYEYK
jgi:ribosomal protein S18 acetylase RimI-like enzyme